MPNISSPKQPFVKTVVRCVTEDCPLAKSCKRRETPPPTEFPVYDLYVPKMTNGGSMVKCDHWLDKEAK